MKSTNSAGVIATITLFWVFLVFFRRGRGEMLMLRGPSAHARHYSIFHRKGNCSRPATLDLVQEQMLQAMGNSGLASAPLLISPGLRCSPCCTLPHNLGLCCHTSLQCCVQLCCSGTQNSPPVQSHDLILPALAWGHSPPRQKPQEVQQGKVQSSTPGVVLQLRFSNLPV